MPGLKRARQSFTFEYKLKVIARADEIGNRAAAREFEIDESMILYWRKKKDVMTKLPNHQRTCRTGVAKFPAVERTVDLCCFPLPPPQKTLAPAFSQVKKWRTSAIDRPNHILLQCILTSLNIHPSNN